MIPNRPRQTDMYVSGGGEVSVPCSLRPLLTQLREQRNVLSEVDGGGTVGPLVQ